MQEKWRYLWICKDSIRLFNGCLELTEKRFCQILSTAGVRVIWRQMKLKKINNVILTRRKKRLSPKFGVGRGECGLGAWKTSSSIKILCRELKKISTSRYKTPPAPERNKVSYRKGRPLKDILERAKLKRRQESRHTLEPCEPLTLKCRSSRLPVRKKFSFIFCPWKRFRAHVSKMV